MIRRFTFLAALAVVMLAVAAPLAAADPIYATVDGYLPGTAANNKAATFGDDCFKIDPDTDSFVLDADYALVIVKAGSEASNPGFVNTVFEDAAAGETVWADTNGDGIFNPGGPGGDKGISHIILCPPEVSETPTPTPTPSETPSDTPVETPVETPSDTPPGAPPAGGPPPDTAMTAPLDAAPWLALGLGALIALAALNLIAARRRA